MSNAAIINIATETRNKLAEQRLTMAQAKLYSQNLLKSMGRDGLTTFNVDHITEQVRNALLLIHLALIERRDVPDSNWRDGIKRAGEILEWLSQKDLLPQGAPFHLLSAAAYQVAGYPALALGHLQNVPEDRAYSGILFSFVKGDFVCVLTEIGKYWSAQIALGEEDGIDPDQDISALTFNHLVRCIGVICDFLRTGEDFRVRRTLEKMDKLADNFLLSRDHFSWVLARLIAELSQEYVRTSLWSKIGTLTANTTQVAKGSLVEFTKASFLKKRSLVWPSQIIGINKLVESNSFVLCTPTGSGKTTIATLAAIQALNVESRILGLEGLTDNLVLYLVPSKALAAEVEERLSQDLTGISPQSTVITGLYGGTDWGPTDAWISRDQPTVLICTYEKADALLRYLGVLFLSRVRLVVIDEAHMVEYTDATLQALQEGVSRAYRLEMLGTRLLMAQEVFGFRMIALSAVAAQAGPAISSWITRNVEGDPIRSDYRSTRQMIGRIEVDKRGRFKIEYDLMNGHSLLFEDRQSVEKPYINNPFSPMLQNLESAQHPQKRMRAPTLWAALHLAAKREDGSQATVLISITQDIPSFAESCLNNLEEWPGDKLPDFFQEPEDHLQWQQCLACARDYFSESSYEYRLLKRGILVHHGKMPALMARKLKKVIDANLVNVVIATSTLSEGVNIPVNYILLPSVRRNGKPFAAQEFGNLVGRAGRPGIATEGHTLAVLPPEVNGSASQERNAYSTIITNIENSASQHSYAAMASSPLLVLLASLKEAWAEISGKSSDQDFTRWLEQTAVTEDEDNNAIKSLDSLDAFLIAAIQEVESLRGGAIIPADLETELIRIWQTTYAKASAQEEERLKTIWLIRGKAIQIAYPDKAQREKIYKTSLPPRSAKKLIHSQQALINTIEAGRSYALMDREEKLAFIASVIEMISGVPAFKLSGKLGKNTKKFDWKEILRWWFARDTLAEQPAPKKISEWYDYVAKNFVYKITWGIGSLLSLVMGDESVVGDTPIRALELDDWPRSGLPWIAFWLKELITWGTLDPVAAFLLARTSSTVDRATAEEQAQQYYASRFKDFASTSVELSGNDLLDPRNIRDFVTVKIQKNSTSLKITAGSYDVALDRSRQEYLMDNINVYPLMRNGRTIWLDAAGYQVANSNREIILEQPYHLYQFSLNVANTQVECTPYLRFR